MHVKKPKNGYIQYNINKYNNQFLGTLILAVQ